MNLGGENLNSGQVVRQRSAGVIYWQLVRYARKTMSDEYSLKLAETGRGSMFITRIRFYPSHPGRKRMWNRPRADWRIEGFTLNGNSPRVGESDVRRLAAVFNTARDEEMDLEGRTLVQLGRKTRP